MATAKYKDLLIETTIITHTGSGPVDPAPKEKETKSPVEDGTGQGTKQAATGHPNVIPPISALKKDLAKEGIEYSDEKIKELSEIEDMITEDLSQFDIEDLEEFKKTSPLMQRMAGAWFHKKAKKVGAGIGPKDTMAASLTPSGKKAFSGKFVNYMDKYRDVMSRREIPASTRSALMKRGVDRAVKNAKERKVAKEGISYLKKELAKEGLEIKDMSKQDLIEYIKTKPLLKRVFADPKYKARRDDVLGARGIPPATRKAGKKLSANVASARKDVSDLKQKKANRPLDKKYGGSFQTLDSLKNPKFEAIEFALETCGMDEEELQELTKTRKLSTRISKTLNDPTYRERKKSLLQLRKRKPQVRKAQSQKFQQDWDKGDASDKQAMRKADYMGPQQKRDVAAKGGGWDKTRRQRDREKEKTIMKGYRADKKARPFLAGARPGGIRHKV